MELSNSVVILMFHNNINSTYTLIFFLFFFKQIQIKTVIVVFRSVELIYLVMSICVTDYVPQQSLTGSLP